MGTDSYHFKSEKLSPFGEEDAASQVLIASHNVTSLCGASIKAAGFLPPSSKFNQADTDKATCNDIGRHATVGGIVIVGGLPYALTVAQPFAAPIPVTTGENASEDQKSTEEAECAEPQPPCITWYEDAIFKPAKTAGCSTRSTHSKHTKPHQLDVAKKSRSKSLAESTCPCGSFAAYALSTLGVSCVYSLDHGADADEVTPDDATSDKGTFYEDTSDDDTSGDGISSNTTAPDPSAAANWALVALDDAFLYPNTYTHIASGNLTTISRPQTPANLSRTEKVLVLAATGEVKVGLLDQEDTGPARNVGDSLGLWRLDARLERYDVGSWVVKGEMLLGVVVAVDCVGTDWVVSRAYVMSVEAVFASIRQAMHVEEVRLPRYNEVEGFRKPAQEVDEDWILLSN